MKKALKKIIRGLRRRRVAAARMYSERHLLATATGAHSSRARSKGRILSYHPARMVTKGSDDYLRRRLGERTYRLRRPCESLEYLGRCSRCWRGATSAARKAAGYEMVQAQEAHPNGTAARPFAAHLIKAEFSAHSCAGPMISGRRRVWMLVPTPKFANYAAASLTKHSGVTEISARGRRTRI
jgi:hypothetical protein